MNFNLMENLNMDPINVKMYQNHRFYFGTRVIVWIIAFRNVGVIWIFFSGNINRISYDLTDHSIKNPDFNFWHTHFFT